MVALDTALKHRGNTYDASPRAFRETSFANDRTLGELRC